MSRSRPTWPGPTDTAVRVYEGEVEHFTSAQSEGIGIRVVQGRPHRLRVRRHAGSGRGRRGAGRGQGQRELRDARRVGRPGRARRRGPSSSRTSGGRSCCSLPTADKIALAKELERLTLAADSRVRVDEADYADVQRRGRGGHQHRHRHRGPGDRRLPVGQHAGRRRRRHPHRLRVHGRALAGRLRSRAGGPGGGRAGHPAARRHQAEPRGR